jgi:hypothetical protein
VQARIHSDEILLQVVQGVRLKPDQSTCRVVGCRARRPARSHTRLITAVAQARDRDPNAGLFALTDIRLKTGPASLDHDQV